MCITDHFGCVSLGLICDITSLLYICSKFGGQAGPFSCDKLTDMKTFASCQFICELFQLSQKIVLYLSLDLGFLRFLKRQDGCKQEQKTNSPRVCTKNTFRSHKQYSPAICINTVFVSCQRVKQIMKTLIHAGVVDIKPSQCITNSHNAAFSFGLLIEMSSMKSPSVFN